MEKIGPEGATAGSRLKLEAESHEELIQVASLLMPTAEGTWGTSNGRSNNMRGALRWEEGINLPPGLTVATVELINGIFPLLKVTQYLVQCVELGLAGATVATSEIRPHRMSGRKVGNLKPDAWSDRLADHHLCGGVIRMPFLQFPLEGLEKNQSVMEARHRRRRRNRM